MKKLVVLIIGLHIIGCASSPQANDKQNLSFTEPEVTLERESATQPPAEAKDEAREEAKKETKPETKVAPVVISTSLYNTLNDAIKNQNDELIQKSSMEILTQNSKDIKALNSLALVYYKKGRLEAAQFLLNKGLLANAKSSELHSNLGLVYLAKNERREAVKSFKKALEINSQDMVAGANLGAIYTQEKDYMKAALSLEVSIKKGSSDPKILNNYAIALSATGRIKEAGEIYAKLLKDNPSHREAMLNYSILLIENMQKNKEGLDLLNRLKFVGAPQDSRDTIKNLENKAKAGLK